MEWPEQTETNAAHEAERERPRREHRIGLIDYERAELSRRDVRVRAGATVPATALLA